MPLHHKAIGLIVQNLGYMLTNLVHSLSVVCAGVAIRDMLNNIAIQMIERNPRNRPNFLLGVSATYQPSQDYLFTINGQVRGKQFASSFVTGPLYLDSYSQIDAVAVWKATKRMDISLKLLNALDEEIEEAVGVPSPGRSVRLGLHFQM